MMEESRDGHMETDVSSTTDDLPESMEVTASQGQMEMVIVVENVNEDGTNAAVETSEPSEKEEKTSSVIVDENKTKSPDCTVKTSPIKSDSPMVTQKSSKKPLADSSTKPETTTAKPEKSPMKLNETQKLSPVKVIEIQKNSPVKVVEVQKNSPAKVTDIQKISPIKIAEVQKISPIKIAEVQKISPVNIFEAQKSSAQSPAKETKITEKLPIKIIALPYKTNIDINTQETAKESANVESVITENNIDGKLTETTKDNPLRPTICTLNDSEIEASNDSQPTSDLSEKEHNKSISRELKSLIKSAKESKIISECTQLTSKTRKSRSNLDNSNTSLNVSVEADKIQGRRRESNNSQVSNSSEKSEKPVKRSMRSHNPEFVSKCKQFLNSVTGKIVAETPPEDDELKNKSDSKLEQTGQTPPKKKKNEEYVPEKMSKLRSDPYCWRCHYAVELEPNVKSHPPIMCTVCPRSFHYKCLSSVERKFNPEKNWVCPDCIQILHAESSETRSPAMKKITLGMLCELLKYALERMMEINGVEPFLQPVDRTLFPDYDKYVVHPMDLTQMKQNISDGHYGSTEAFIADAQWILHNSIIFNTSGQVPSKLVGGARALVRSCRGEMGEIEACSECYSGAHARKSTWFTDVCSTPHILLWAKLKGFPYWPAKGMTVNAAGLVDVRFFGAHDRAWVHAKDCFLYSEKDPNNFRSKRQDILDSMQEAEDHIRNISRKYGKFVYPPFKTQFDPTKLTEQLKMMIPSFEGEIKIAIKEKASSASPVINKSKNRSSSKSSKSSSANDGEMSECDDSLSVSRLSSVDSKDTNDTASVDKNRIEISASPSSKTDVPSRKRRRSNLEEAVLTVLENTPAKRKRNDDNTEKNDLETTSNTEPTSTDQLESSKKDPKNVIKESESSGSTENKESLRVTPIKLVALPRPNKQTPKLFTTTKVTSKASPKPDDKTPQKTKPNKDKSLDKSLNKKAEKRRNSRNKSINATSTPKADKISEKRDGEASTTQESRQTDNGSSKKKDGDVDKPVTRPQTERIKSNGKAVNFDDDTTLAVIARETRSSSSLPTISSVRSLSTTVQTSSTTSATNTTTNGRTIEICEPSIFVPTSTDNVRTMKEAVDKLQKLREPEKPQQPAVGRVGVRAFARMTSPDRNDGVQVEIKAEPIDLEEVDAERQMEKMDLMNACKLRPVNQVQSTKNLRDVRINKVVVTPTVIIKKNTAKSAESRTIGKKTFPQPKRTEEGRSELNGKNSMVYIPIQPPMTQAPVRPIRQGANGPATPTGPRMPGSTATGNNLVNTVTPPLRPTLSSPATSTSLVATTSAATMPTTIVPAAGGGPALHTVPLMTSVNGHWMFSLQPVMPVGCVDNTNNAPVVNGLAERAVAAPMVPINNSVSVTPIPSTQNRTNDTNTTGEMPRLQQRPVLMNPLDPATPVNILPAPSAAGTLTAKLNQSAVKMADFFRNLLEECIEKLEDPVAQAATAKLQLEQLRWRHQQEMDEIRHNHELTLSEMRLSFEKEKVRAVNEARRAMQIELEAAVKQAKSKQWCSNCNQEAQLYCCWNTAYCDYPCQRAHWAQHHAQCTHHPNKNDGDSTDQANQSESRLQSQPDNLPALQKNVSPAVTVTAVANKVTATRVYTHDTNSQAKSSIIVSMVEDNSGNQTMKCVGTYKSPTQPQNIPPIIINKQIMTEDAAKKVVTSGGYLIVGASGNSNSVITPATAAGRRPPSLHYYS